jgi:hypothetical protein
MTTKHISHSYTDSYACDNTYVSTFEAPPNLAGLLSDLVVMGGHRVSKPWSQLVKPLTINGEFVEHVEGMPFGEMYEDVFVNGIHLERDTRSGRFQVKVYTHWMGTVVCEFHLVIVKGKFESCTMNKFSLGTHIASERDAIKYICALGTSLSLDKSFKFSKI